MFNLKPVHRIEDLKVNDLIYYVSRFGNDLYRIGCIDGAQLYLITPHDNLSSRDLKTTIEDLLMLGQILKVYNEKSNP